MVKRKGKRGVTESKTNIDSGHEFTNEEREEKEAQSVQ